MRGPGAAAGLPGLSGLSGLSALTVLAALAVLMALTVLSLLLGAAGFGVPDAAILWQLRVPRTGLALLVGGGLGLSGAVLQGVLRNPLADPGFLGVGGCAALGAVCVFYWGLAAAFPPALALGGLLGAALGCGALLLIFARAQSGPGLILAGIGVSAIAAALLALVLSAAPNPFALYEITFWLMGGLEDRTPLHLALAAPPVALGCALLLRLGPGLDALSLGEETAASLGVPVRATLAAAVIGVALAVGAGAAVAGGIGFVGLVVPHLLRPWFGARPGALLAPSLVAGAALLLAADCLARAAALWLPLAAEPRLGVLTALLGAPFLMAIAGRAAP
jgi:iron complex transport system permease protein